VYGGLRWQTTIRSRRICATPCSRPDRAPGTAVPKPSCAPVAATVPVRTPTPVPARIAAVGGGAAGALATPGSIRPTAHEAATAVFRPFWHGSGTVRVGPLPCRWSMAFRCGSYASELVGIARFEPAASSSRRRVVRFSRECPGSRLSTAGREWLADSLSPMIAQIEVVWIAAGSVVADAAAARVQPLRLAPSVPPERSIA
jgi:hypothetical protein